MTASTQRELTASEQDWLAVRAYLGDHRYQLSVEAAAEFPDHVRAAGAPLLTQPAWIPGRPIPLADLTLDFVEHAGVPRVTGVEKVAPDLLPVRPDGARYSSYADAVGALASPAVFENRPTYRLVDADLAGSRPTLRFGRGSYFDGTNTGDAAAHEYVASRLQHAPVQPLRAAIGDPCDLAGRPVNVAITTLTVRYDRTNDAATFLLHWRDPAKVGHAGGLYQVVPVGIFQPSGHAVWNERNDFSLWRNIVRELAEELLGADEDHNSEHAPIDYERWPFAAKLAEGRARGSVRAYLLGLGTDPLTYATDLLTAVVIDAPLYDELFGELVTDNAEGRILEAKEFATESVDEAVARHPMQAAGAALLRLAVQQRSGLLTAR